MDRNFPPLYLSGLQKPVVLVVAMKLAVGGVERNTIEIIRNLCDRYTFVYLTLEKIYPSAGSLASQVIDAGALLLDFAEILPKEAHLEALEWLQSTLNPDLVWVCNGSMWLCRYAKAFRAIFNSVPIIDQQVYDTEAGWIQHYNDEGIKDFDHHIAINSRIRDAFITQYGKSPSKISLIYPVFDPAKCIAANCISLNEKRDIRKELDLPEERKIFCFVGRLSEQKQPFRFLQLAKKRIGNNDEYFVMVGDGPLSNDVDRWLEDNNLTNFCRMKYIEDVPRFYSIVDGLVIVSRYEGLPIAMLEALAVGVPVLSTDVGDVKLVLEEYGSGRIFDCNLENTSSVFGSEFEQFKCRLNNYSSKALESRNIVLQRFSAKTVASKYENCFKVALSQFRK